MMDELDLSRCALRRWHSPAALALDPSFLLLDDETFVGRSLQASFTEAAWNNIVPAFGRVRSHITGCSIRNRPRCGTINPVPSAAHRCSNSPARGDKSNLEGESHILSPAAWLLLSPSGLSLHDCRYASSCYHIITGDVRVIGCVGKGTPC